MLQRRDLKLLHISLQTSFVRAWSKSTTCFHFIYYILYALYACHICIWFGYIIEYIIRFQNYIGSLFCGIFQEQSNIMTRRLPPTPRWCAWFYVSCGVRSWRNSRSCGSGGSEFLISKGERLRILEIFVVLFVGKGHGRGFHFIKTE